jgi:hypothetical protein
MEASCFVKSFFLLIYGRQDSIVQCIVVYFYENWGGGGRGVFALWLSTCINLSEKIISKLSGLL